MVTSFVDGDDSIGYTMGYGPEEGPQATNFGSDLQGVYDRLEDISNNGFNTIWLTPIFDSYTNESVSDHCRKLDGTGYYTVNYFAIDPNFGTEDMFKKVVNHAHELGIYVILDGVFGHWKSSICGVDSVVESPNGNLPVALEEPYPSIEEDSEKLLFASYPDSLDFFIEVAQYWITEFNIDGWRLDQSYQLRSSDGTEYVDDIREAVETLCDERKEAGEEWGILGYVVGEYFYGGYDRIITLYGDEGDTLYSFFDFPSYYELMRVFGENYDDTNHNNPITIYNTLKNTKDAYPEFAHSNLFLSNHDVWRFGNTIQKRYPSFGNDTTQYWNLFQAAYLSAALYNGPITVFYGDEIGTFLYNYTTDGDYGASDDNMGRYNLKIDSLSDEELVLKERLGRVFKYRNNNEVMYHKNSTYELKLSSSIYVEFKKTYEDLNGVESNVFYALNYQNDELTKSFEYIGTLLQDIITDEYLNSSSVHFNQYQARLLRCADFDPSSEESSSVGSSSVNSVSSDVSSSGDILDDSATSFAIYLISLVISLLLLL
ncbi:Glycosyl hydrolase family 13 catalytic domain-containing protein [Entamoeba marina]